MKAVNVGAAKTHLSRLIQDARSGEDIVVSKAGIPMVRHVPVKQQNQTAPRKLGRLRGKMWEREGCWEPDPEVEALFYARDARLFLKAPKK